MKISTYLPQIIEIYHDYQLPEHKIKLSQFLQLIGLYNLFVTQNIVITCEAFCYCYVFQLIELFSNSNANRTISNWTKLKLTYYGHQLYHHTDEWYCAWWAYQIMKEYHYQINIPVFSHHRNIN